MQPSPSEPEQVDGVALADVTRFEEGEPTLGEGEEPELLGGDPEGGDDLDLPDGPEEGPATRGLRLSKHGVRFIGRYEGWRAEPYNDAVGHCTIGYGHLLHLGNCRRADFDRFAGGLDEVRGVRLLRKDATHAANAVRALGVPLEQHEFDALVSFTFNLGGGWTGGSGLQRALAAGDHARVPRELSKWVYAGSPPRQLEGLVRRRRAEGVLFKRGKYGTGP